MFLRHRYFFCIVSFTLNWQPSGKSSVVAQNCEKHRVNLQLEYQISVSITDSLFCRAYQSPFFFHSTPATFSSFTAVHALPYLKMAKEKMLSSYLTPSPAPKYPKKEVKKKNLKEKREYLRHISCNLFWQRKFNKRFE